MPIRSRPCSGSPAELHHSKLFSGLCAAFLAVCGCLSTEPSEEEFSIISVEFTGDSTPPESRALSSAWGFTVSWQPVSAYDTYWLYRSEEPSIQSDLSSASLICYTEDSSCADLQGLCWDTEYYYAVMGFSNQGVSGWTDEVAVKTPEIPQLIPRELLSERERFCWLNLSWTGSESEYFTSYTLIRSLYSGIEHNSPYQNLELLFTDDIDCLEFSDSVPSLNETYYYALKVSYNGYPDVYSNEICVYMEVDAPYEVKAAWLDHHTSHHTIIAVNEYYLYDISQCDDSFSREFEDGVQRRDPDTGILVSFFPGDISCATLLHSDDLAACGFSENGEFRLWLLSQSLAELAQVSLPSEPIGVTAVPGGILVSGEQCSWLFDTESLELLQTLEEVTFSEAVVTPDSTVLFLKDSTNDIYAVTLPEFNQIGSVGRFPRFYIGSNGHLFCSNDSRAVEFNPYSLQRLNEFEYPQWVLPYNGSSFLTPDCEYIYGWKFADGGIRISIFDFPEGQYMWSFEVCADEVYGPEELISSEDGSSIWCLCLHEMQKPLYVKIGI